MDFDEINQILELIRAHGLAEFELERDDLHIRLRKAETPLATLPGPKPGAPEAVNRPSATAEPASGRTGESGATIVEAPILGTFFRASAPDASPFVEVGAVGELDGVGVARGGDGVRVGSAGKVWRRYK